MCVCVCLYINPLENTNCQVCVMEQFPSYSHQKPRINSWSNSSISSASHQRRVSEQKFELFQVSPKDAYSPEFESVANGSFNSTSEAFALHFSTSESSNLAVEVRCSITSSDQKYANEQLRLKFIPSTVTRTQKRTGDVICFSYIMCFRLFLKNFRMKNTKQNPEIKINQGKINLAAKN